MVHMKASSFTIAAVLLFTSCIQSSFPNKSFVTALDDTISISRSNDNVDDNINSNLKDQEIVNSNDTPIILPNDGPANFQEGERLFQLAKFDEAALHYWKAVLGHGKSSASRTDTTYTLALAFGKFIECYRVQDKTIDAFIFVATESMKTGQTDMSRIYVNQALQMDPTHSVALELQRLLDGGALPTQGEINSVVQDQQQQLKRAKDLFNQGLTFFNEKQYAACSKAFQDCCDIAKELPTMDLNSACTNAVYCRSNNLDWGLNGSQFETDMETITTITKEEVEAWRSTDQDGNVQWNRQTSAHPHMLLGYPVDPELKSLATESYAYLDEPNMRMDPKLMKLKDLPSDLPFTHDGERWMSYLADAAEGSNNKIKVAFVSAAFQSKAVLYLSHDMFRFFDKDKFEMHIYSVNPPDNPLFIKNAMRGVDWRERVKANVDYFHDVEYLKNDHIGLARKIYEDKIHILIEWDGYARQGLRAQGLFALKPAPIQVLHQEFLGTTGAPFVDYIVTDQVASPESLEHLYAEKYLVMPDHFFSKGHAVQAEVKDPTYEFKLKERPYKLGTGSPQENRCLAPENMEPVDVSFVYCNFNKFLKNNPETARSWIEILRKVPNSILCLLENPQSGVPYLRKFINEEASSSGMVDGEDLIKRIRFLPWEANPYDHQMRNQDFCNAILDNTPYNGHTTAQDALYGGVPIVTRSDGDDMSSRVTTSANIVLGLTELNSYDAKQYEDIAIKLGVDQGFFHSIRNRLIDTCLQREPMHPYWDVKRYVMHFEMLLKKAWETYLSGEEPRHQYINDERLGSDEL